MRFPTSVSRGSALCAAALMSFVISASAQSSFNATPTTPFLSLTTSSVQTVSTSRSGASLVPFTTFVPTVFEVTITPSATSRSSSSASSSASASPSATSISLDTKIDPAFGVLGGLLILTGIPSAFLGHKNRWSSFFLMGFYTLSLTCAVLIIRFGVLSAENLPSQTLRGMYILACAVAGIIGGGVTIFFWKGTKYFVGAWGGFAFGLWIQCFRDGGLIRPIGFRYIMYIAFLVVGFTACTITRIHYYVVIISTAFVGATAFMIGVDCFTTQNLKEFYIWNLGFDALFPKYTSRGIHFPVSQGMEIELGLLGAVALMGIAMQLRILKILKRKLEEIAVEARRRNQDEDAQVAERFNEVDVEREEWEKAHPADFNAHGRQMSGASALTPLMKYGDHTPGTPVTPATAYDGVPSLHALEEGTRPRKPSGLSEYNPDGRRSQSPGAIPALDLGTELQEVVPDTFMAEGSSSRMASADPAGLEELHRKEALLAEIQSLRKSIHGLKEDGSSAQSRRLSMSSRRTLSNDLNTAFGRATPSSLVPLEGTRSRVQSMALSNISQPDPVPRSSSAPLVAEDWDAYVQERKLLQPPAGVTAPIATSPTSPYSPVAPAVVEALAERHRREESFRTGQPLQPSARRPTTDLAALQARIGTNQDASSEDLPLAALAQARQHERKPSNDTRAPVTILPPAKTNAPRPQLAPRTRTHEELTERHREKIREMQAPVSAADKERSQLDAAKNRWSRSMAAERDAVQRRQAEKAAELAAREGDARKSADASRPSGHARSLSADKLAMLPGASSSARRQSTMKVEDWQKQHSSQDNVAEPTASRRMSKAPAAPAPAVPFPDNRASRRMSSAPREYPN